MVLLLRQIRRITYMPYLAVCIFRESVNSHHYHYIAFSPEDTTRRRSMARRDIMHQIGFQLSHPTDKNTLEGYLEEYIERDPALPLADRQDAIRCVVRADHTINTSYEAVSVNGEYALSEGVGHWQTIPHFYVQANLGLEADSDSDSTDSSDSDDS